MKQMKLLLLIIGLALVRGTYAHKERHENLTGSWHTIAVAANNTAKIKKEGPFRLSLHQIIAKDGKLYGEFSERKKGKCIRLLLASHKTDKENQYVSIYSGANIFYFTHVKPDEYIMVTLYNYDGNDITLVLMLTARQLNVREEIKKKFEELCLYNKLKKENIVYFTKHDQCEKLAP
ncbi:trichosurin-like [Antechinus flavipes]|uniref:trichosurin-like n=1 Tax=Antechinus flavipes TaxID=38775 RepID=UPI002235F7C3|nr:trichosurin-like [Antechinus flavipes]